MLKLCPTCHRDLEEVERMGVLVDFCPKCRSIWLEEGELEQVRDDIRTMEFPSDASVATPRFVTVYETSTFRSRDNNTITPGNSSFSLRDIFRER